MMHQPPDGVCRQALLFVEVVGVRHARHQSQRLADLDTFKPCPCVLAENFIPFVLAASKLLLRTPSQVECLES